MGISRREIGWQTDQLEQLCHALSPLAFPLRELMNVERFGDGSPDSRAWVERRERVLKYQADTPRQRPLVWRAGR
jgi:hypothetical protein